MNENLKGYTIYKPNEVNFIVGAMQNNQFNEYFINHAGHLLDRVMQPQVPRPFPDYETFCSNFDNVMAERQKIAMVKDSQVTASGVAFFGRYEWQRLEGRGISLIDYTYYLAQLMCDPITYKTTFASFDPIRISINWHIENERHRALALKSMGESVAMQVGLNNWIDIDINR